MPERKQVLVICRTAAGQMYLGVVLNRIWYAPVLASNVDDALELARTTSFSLVVYDADAELTELPANLGRLHVEPTLKKAPIALFLTSATRELSESLLQQGCSAVLTKPLDLAIVYGVLGRLSGQPRNSFRAPVRTPVEIREGTPERYLTSMNISEGGMYLRTPEPLPDGTVIHVAFTLPRDTERLELAAAVVRVLPLGTQFEAVPGMGLQFLEVSDHARSRIRSYIQWEMMGDLEKQEGEKR